MTDERIRALERSVANAPADATTRLALARELARAGRREAARGHVAQVLRAEPLSAEAVRTLDELGSGPLAGDAPWPTTAGGNDHARRSSQPGARRGELVKRVRIGRDGETASSMTASAGTVYVASSSSRLIALDLATGSPRWIRDFQTLVRAPAIGEGERLLVAAEGAIQLLDGARGGETLWSLRCADERPFVAFAPRGLVLVASGDLVEAASVTTGKVQWRYKATGRITVSPVLDRSAVFVASSGGTIDAVDFEGRLASRLRVPRGDPLQLAMIDEALYVHSIIENAPGGQGMFYVVGRDGSKLGKKMPLPGHVGLNVCAIDRERVVWGGRAPGTGAALVSASGARQDLGRDMALAVSDSGGCLFAVDDRGVHWFDSTATIVKTVLPGANDVGPLTIGPDSTLLVASPRGILHVIA